MKKLGLYLHIPFCRSKCLYCDFCSFPKRDQELHDAYVNALCVDLSSRAADCTTHTVDSIYLGGGTPTMLAPELLNKLLETILQCYRVTTDVEITLECNPATANKASLSSLRHAGFNRISIGLQSSEEQELRALGRLHSFADFERTFSDARDAGFSNISTDLMFGISHQTLESYLQSIRRLSALSPDHISAYGLTVEADTPFGRMGEGLSLPDEEETRQMYFEGIEELKRQGYTQYEISNFSKIGYQSRHNLKYWNCEEYLGFGPAAYSDFGGQRFGNSRELDAYLKGEPILEETETPDTNERINEYIMLRLRLSEGIDTSVFQKRFGADFDTLFSPCLQRYEAGGFVQRTAHGWALTTQGFYVSNTILSDLLDFSNQNSL